MLFLNWDLHYFQMRVYFSKSRSNMVFQLSLEEMDDMDLYPRKPVFGGLRTTKVQTSLCSLISTFVIHLLIGIISKLATIEILIF